MKTLHDLSAMLGVDIEQQSDCWIWGGRINTSGYGAACFNGQRALAHRLTYQLLIGPIPEGLQLDHLCRTLLCVNPGHLEPVTDLENKRRRYATYTHCANGHEFTEANTYIRTKSGHRDCRACIRERVRRYKERKSNA